MTTPIVEHRAADQDAALEQTFVDGTALDVLPAVDRRTPAQKAEDEAMMAAAEDAALAPGTADQFDGSTHSVAAVLPTLVEDHLAALPVGSRVTWERTDLGDKWTVYRGPGVAAHGEGPTLTQAIRVIGARYEHDPDLPSRRVLVNEHGDAIVAEHLPI